MGPTPVVELLDLQGKYEDRVRGKVGPQNDTQSAGRPSDLDRCQPPALMLWGRHDIFFDLKETISWMKALPRMEAHILDGPHLLLETHPAECAALMNALVGRAERLR